MLLVVLLHNLMVEMIILFRNYISRWGLVRKCISIQNGLLPADKRFGLHLTSILERLIVFSLRGIGTGFIWFDEVADIRVNVACNGLFLSNGFKSPRVKSNLTIVF